MSTWPNRGGLRRPLRGAGREKDRTQEPSDQVGLTQANWPPRNPVRFRQLCGPESSTANFGFGSVAGIPTSLFAGS